MRGSISSSMKEFCSFLMELLFPNPSAMPSKNKGKNRLDGCEDIQDSISSILSLRDYLTSEEALEIHQQFSSSVWELDKQVLWSGMLRKDAQTWADEHYMQTLTTALGSLLLPNSPRRPGKKAPDLGWSQYLHGASAIFAWHIANGDKVTVLSPPPPQRFHPSGLAFFQVIELPILRAAIAKGADLCIEIVHPGVKAAENYPYQLWPQDEASRWTAAFHKVSRFKYNWRKVSGKIKGVPTEQALAQMTRERDRTVSTVRAASATEPSVSPERSNVSEETVQENQTEKMVDCSTACAKRVSKKCKKKKKKIKKAPTNSSTPVKKEDGRDSDDSAACKGPTSLIDDAIAAMELQYQLDFPKSQRARLPPATYPVKVPEQMGPSPSSTDLQVENLDGKKTSPKAPKQPTSSKVSESNNMGDLKGQKTSKLAKRKMREAQRAVKEKQMTPEQRGAELAKRARKANKKAIRKATKEATRKAIRKATKKAASDERKAASASERQGFEIQRRELQELVGVTLLENFPFPVSMNTF